MVLRHCLGQTTLYGHFNFLLNLHSAATLETAIASGWKWLTRPVTHGCAKAYQFLALSGVFIFVSFLIVCVNC